MPRKLPATSSAPEAAPPAPKRTRTKEASRARKPAPKPPRYILWEVSRACTLGCKLCRHSSLPVGASKDMSADEGVRFIDSIARTLPAQLHFTGPEPLARPDLFELARYAATRGLIVHLATNANTMDFHAARSCVESKIRQVEFHIDGSSGRFHDGFRNNPGSFAKAIKGLELIRMAGIKFKIACTVTRANVAELPKMLNLAQKLGAIGMNIFFNIPVGRGVHFPEDPIPEDEYIAALNWIFDQEMRHPNYIHLQCSPQYERIYRQRAEELPRHLNPFTPGSEHMVKDHGCPAGRDFLFVGHDGRAYPCPYLLQPVGNVLEQSVGDIWAQASLLGSMREPAETGGKCRTCKFVSDCRGCRALAFKKYEDPMQEDPACKYLPS